MRICPKCRRRFPENVRTCPDDGEELLDEQGDTAIQSADRLKEGARQANRASRDTPTRRDAPPNLTKSPTGPSPATPGDGVGAEPTDVMHQSNQDTSHPTDVDAMDTSDLIGERLFGEYNIVDKLGEGGMGAVYLAQQASIDQKIAVKVLHEDSADDHETVQRFHREARVVSMLTHPNIIRVFIFGRTPSGLLYLAMEYVKGVPLRDVLDRGMLEEMRAITIMKQICSALSEAHDFGIIHRDLKPDNVLLTEWRGEEDFAKILDFGIAKLKQPDSKQEQQKLTQAGIVYGTPEYLSPEQAQALELDNRTDIYSLGCILYEMMTGRLPFNAPTPVKIMTAHVYNDLTPPSEVAPNRVSPTMENIIMKAMAKDPDDRFQDGMDMFEALVAREQEIVQEQRIEGRGAYVPGMEVTGMFRAVDIEEAAQNPQASQRSPSSNPTSNPNQSTPSQGPPSSSGPATAEVNAGSPTAQRNQQPPTTAPQQRTPEESSDNLRLIIYLLIAGTGLLFAVLIVAIVFLMLQ